MELHQLRYFVAAAEAGSISRAAQRCGVAQPSLSQQIRRLEESLGVRLFDRLGRGVALTDEGRALVPRARRILGEVREAEMLVRSEDGEGAGRLSVGAIPTIAPYLLPGPLARLLADHPGCDVSVREDYTERLLERLADTEIDVAIVSTPVEHDLIETEVIGDEALLVVTPVDHPFAAGNGVSLAALRSEPTIALHEMHCLGRQISGFCAVKRIAPKVVCHAAQLSTLLEFVRLGMGVSLVPEMASRADASRERVYLPVLRGGPRREIALAWRSGRTKPAMARRLAAFVRQELETPATRPRTTVNI